MEITINKDSDKIIQEQNFLWKVLATKTLSLAAVFLLIGLLLIFFDAATNYSVKRYVDSSVTLYDYHITLSIGIALILTLYLFYKTKKSHFRDVDTRIFNQEPNSVIIKLFITDHGIFYKSRHLKQEISWSAFTHYKLRKHYLVLSSNKDFVEQCVINTNDLDKQESYELAAFIEKRLLKK